MAIIFSLYVFTFSTAQLNEILNTLAFTLHIAVQYFLCCYVGGEIDFILLDN